MKELKPFDLEAAKRGEPVVTYRGEVFEYVGLYAGLIVGKCGNGFYQFDKDLLRMAPKKRTVLVNFYPDGKAYWNDEPMEGTENAIAIAVPVEIEE